MVKLPTIQPRGSVTRGPQSSVSGAEVASPFQQIADAFNSAGEFVNKKALDDSRVSGQDAVSRDADGNLKVDLKSNWSERDRVYNRYATQTFAAQSEIEIKGAMSRLQQDAKGNPEVFGAGAKSFRDNYLTGTPAQLRGPVKAMLDAEIEMGRNGVMDQKYRSDMAMSKSTLLSSIEMKQNEMAALAFQGGTGTPEYRQRQEDVRVLWGELSGNPIFQISHEEAEMKMNQMEGRHTGEAIVGQAERALQAGDYKKVAEMRQSILADEEIALSPQERRQYAGMINERQSNFNAQRKVVRDALNDRGKERQKLWGQGASLDDPEDDDLIAELKKQDLAAGRALELQRTVQRSLASYRRLDNANQTSVLETVTGAGNVVDRIVGVESGGNAKAKNPNSSATGAGQFISSTWMNMMKQYRPDLVAGKSAAEVLAMRNDPQLSREMTGHYASENAQFLKNQGVLVTDGNVYLAHFLGPRGAVQVLKADPSASVQSVVGEGVVNANPFLRGMSASEVAAWANKKMGGDFTSSVPAELVKEYRQEVTADLKSDLGRWKTEVGNGNIPDQDSLGLLQRQLALVDNQNLRSEYQSIFRQSEAFTTAFKEDPTVAAEFLNSLEATAGGDGVTLAQADIIDAFKKGDAARRTALANDPLGYGSRTGMYQPLKSLNLNDPAEWESTLSSYQDAASTLKARGFVGDISALPPSVEQEVIQRLNNATPGESLSFLSTMERALSPSTYKTTLSKLYASGQARAAATAGALVGDNPAVAEGILRGQMLLKENPNLAPKKTDDNSLAIDEKLPIQAFAAGQEVSRQFLLESATARYADLSHQAGDTSGEFNDTRMQQAVDEVTGGVVDMNGFPVIAPRYGMTQTDFDKRLSQLTDDDLASAVDKYGNRVKPSDLRNQGRLRAVADGLYLIEFGRPDAPMYALRQPSPGNYAEHGVFVLDLRD
ncbi:hypothetical protein [Agrobacterium tumefaciens]|uniref:lytic transglycosylase domain-containing protein n=1 Tax=Agrobacterium tumefaciens TaxID=358 RepID=UPI003B9E4688